MLSMRLRVWKVKKRCVSSTTMTVGTRKSPTFSTTTTNRNHILTTKRVIISLGTTSKATISLSKPQQNPPPGFSNKGNQSSHQQANPSTSTPQKISIDVLLKQILEFQTRSEKQVGYELKNLYSKIDGSYNELNNKEMNPGLKPVAKRADQKLKEVKLEDTTEVEQSPYDKLPFPQRILTKAQKKMISKFRKDLSDIGLKLPAISGMHEAHVQMMLIKDIVDHQAEVAELLNISTLKLDPPVTPKSLPKLESQGKFTLSCSLGKLTFDDALVDSGASVNVISMEMVKSQEELCFINNNGSWYKKEFNFQYNNYQQKSYPNNQQSGYQPRNNQQCNYQPQQNPPPAPNLERPPGATPRSHSPFHHFGGKKNRPGATSQSDHLR
ncbi:hypothetical protein F2Q69_00060864 [Brassica cretica]|uniref:Aspartic peptidase DDI1-type domain-containing protein n=1 Tax=Brassica cretica TaxID=69181 RepID=A0A8S9RB78_BRACR|nr:hypothetical protein F2Q69_00060864 [Brassica cretica]